MKKLEIVLVMLFLLSTLFAKVVSVDQAKAVAINLFTERSEFEHNEISVSGIHTENDGQYKLFYIFNMVPEGFVIVSADDIAIPIIGYSFEGQLQNDKIPTQLEHKLENYRLEIKNAIQQNILATEKIRNQWSYYEVVDISSDIRDFRSVYPLIQARFDQPNPWNAKCPVDLSGPGGHALVGCVAVSMAQVMHYWSYPEYGYGSHNYYHWDYGNISADFENTHYDWSNIPNAPATDDTQTILFHCGVAVDMGYGADGSGAYVGWGNPCAMSAMEDHFLFDDNIHFEEKDNYSDSEWKNLMQAELDQGRPTIYRGYDNDSGGGHAWNIDGYQDEYFHCNWGWGGYANGYFYLNNLSGGGYNFSSGQAAIMGIIPEELNTPNLVLVETNSEEISGDGDGVINPGESANIFVTLRNLPPWPSANNVELVLESQEAGITIINDYITVTEIDSGGTFTNIELPFIIEISQEVQLGDFSFSLFVLSDNRQYSKEFNFDVNVSLHQTGFPFYTSVQVKSSPIVIDIDEDGENEIIFTDYIGLVHCLDQNGTEETNWPFDTGNQVWGAPAVADIDNDGELEVIIGSKSKHLFVLNNNAEIKLDLETEMYLMATASIGNIDEDEELEIIFPGFSTEEEISKIFAINPDGSNVYGFPIIVNDKIMYGLAVADFNDNSKIDIVCSTDNGNVFLYYDNGIIADGFPFVAEDKFKTPPSILQLNEPDEFGFKNLIVVGSMDDNFYAINSNGELRFNIETGASIQTSAGFVDIENIGSVMFFGSDDGYLYGIQTNGFSIPGWPKYLNGKVTVSPVFADFNGDNIPEVVSGNDIGGLYAFHINGDAYQNTPIPSEFAFKSTPAVWDIDNDGDLEIVIGTTHNCTNIDIKQLGFNGLYWNMDRGNPQRTGLFESTINVNLNNSFQSIIKNFHLLTAYPNPFNPSTTIGFTLPMVETHRNTSLHIYNLQGKLVETLINQQLESGYHEVVWGPVGYPSGIYFVQLIVGDVTKTKKLLLLK